MTSYSRRTIDLTNNRVASSIKLIRDLSLLLCTLTKDLTNNKCCQSALERRGLAWGAADEEAGGVKSDAVQGLQQRIAAARERLPRTPG